MRKLAHLFTDLLLGPPPTSLGAASTPRPRATGESAPIAEVIVVDQDDQHLHDFLELFPAETAEVRAPRAPRRLGA